MKKQKLLLISSASLLVAFQFFTILYLPGKVFAAPVTYYNQPGDTQSDNECNGSDLHLNPGIQFINPGAQRGTVYYCVNIPEGSINLADDYRRPSTGCPFGHGGASMSLIGDFCLTNDRTDSAFYPGGEPILSNSGGGTVGGNGNEGGGPGESVTYTKNDCNGTAISAGEPAMLEDGTKNPNHCAILDYLVIFINALSAIVGVVVVASIIYGGIQYSMSGSDPQKTSAAKNRIRNAIIALIFFIFTYSLLNFLVPGGVL